MQKAALLEYGQSVLMGTFRAVWVTLLLCACLSSPQAGHAATNVVSSLSDGLIAGTLRSAIASSSAGDTIIFSSNLNGTITLTSGQLLINKNLTIRGPGAKRITVSGNTNSRVFTVTNAAVSLSGLTIANGRVVGATGASGSVGETVFAAGLLNWQSLTGFEVTVTDCAFIQNTAFGGNGGGTPLGGGGGGGNVYGGAILNNSVLRMNNCCLAGNSATGGNGGSGPAAGGKGGTAFGAGVWNVGFLALTNCTIATNVSRGGNGGSTSSGSISFPGNGGNAEGIAVYNSGELRIISCTISSNSASGGSPGTGGLGAGASRGGAYGGGIRTSAGAMEVGNTIIAGNTGSEAPDVSGDFISRSFNLVGISNGSTGLGTGFDQIGTTNNPINPQLGPLQDNGGPTLTMALLTNSPAIDQGNGFGDSFDQRGADRPSDFPFRSNSAEGTDIGAYELMAPLLGISQSGTNVLLGWSIFNAGYSLQSTTNLFGSNWISVAEAVAIGNRFYVTNATTTESKFFRLHSP